MNKEFAFAVLLLAFVFSGAFLVHRSVTYAPKISDFDLTATAVQNLPEAAQSNPIKLVFVGDIMLSRTIGKIMIKNNDWNYPFLLVSDLLKNADITFGNLEGPISSRGVLSGSIYSFRVDPHAVEGLTASGFDVLSIANNHMWDYGAQAFKDTLSILASSSISYVGGGLSYTEAHTPVIKDVRGTKIAYLAYTNLLPASLGTLGEKPKVAFPDKDQMTSDVKKAKESADIVVVSFHFGDEYKTHHNAYQEKMAHAAIDAGASLVIGHHPHVVQDTEQYNGGYIAYSLGNFVFDQNFSKDTRSGMVVSVSIKDKKIDEFLTQKVQFNSSFQPYLSD